MLTGFIEYFKTTKPSLTVVTTPKEKHWPKKYAESLVTLWQKQGYVKGAVVALRHMPTYKLTIKDYNKVPENGFNFTAYAPTLIVCENKLGHTMSYRFDELILIDTTTGEMTC